MEFCQTRVWAAAAGVALDIADVSLMTVANQVRNCRSHQTRWSAFFWIWSRCLHSIPQANIK